MSHKMQIHLKIFSYWQTRAALCVIVNAWKYIKKFATKTINTLWKTFQTRKRRRREWGKIFPKGPKNDGLKILYFHLEAIEEKIYEYIISLPRLYL